MPVPWITIHGLGKLYFFQMLFFQVVIFILCHVLIVDAKEKPLTEIIEVDTSKIDYSSAKHLPRRSKRLQKPVVYNK